MNIKPIKSKVDYRETMKEVSRLVDLDPSPRSEAGQRLDVLVTLVQAYESRLFPVGAPDPVEAIRFRMEQQGLAAKDLIPMIGGIGRVYEVLNRKRPLTLPMIRRLHAALGIPAGALITESVAA